MGAHRMKPYSRRARNQKKTQQNHTERQSGTQSSPQNNITAPNFCTQASIQAPTLSRNTHFSLFGYTAAFWHLLFTTRGVSGTQFEAPRRHSEARSFRHTIFWPYGGMQAPIFHCKAALRQPILHRTAAFSHPIFSHTTAFRHPLLQAPNVWPDNSTHNRRAGISCNHMAGIHFYEFEESSISMYHYIAYLPPVRR